MPDTKLKNGQRSASAGGGTALVDAPTAPSTRFGGAKVAPPTSTKAPTLAPPMEGGAARAAVGGAAAAARVAATLWLNSQTINALWTINEDKNSWLGVAGVGWMKLANNSDTAIVALTILGAHAKDGQRLVNLRQEDDGMIHEMYVW
jgi:hypothetical protein